MSKAIEPTLREDVYHACELVLIEARQGDGKRTIREDEVTIPFRTLKYVIAALKNEDESRCSEC